MKPISNRSITILTKCANATRAEPANGMPFGWCWHLIDKGLLKFRAFNPREGRGGHYITAKGRKALAASVASK